MLIPLLILAAGALLAASHRRGGSKGPPPADTLSGAAIEPAQPAALDLSRAYREFSAQARSGQLEPTSLAGTIEIVRGAFQGLPEPARSDGLEVVNGLATLWTQGQDSGRTKRALIGAASYAAALGLAALPPKLRKIAKRLERFGQSGLLDRDKGAIIDWLLAQYVDGHISPFSDCRLVAAVNLLELFERAYRLPEDGTLYDGLSSDEHYARWKLASSKKKRLKYNQWFRESINRWAKQSGVVIPHRERTCPTLEYLEKVRGGYLNADNAEALVLRLEPLLRVVLKDKMVPWTGGNVVGGDGVMSTPVPLIR